LSTAPWLLEGWVRKDRYYLEHPDGSLIAKCTVCGSAFYILSTKSQRFYCDNLREAFETWQHMAKADEPART
jgi:hypothetical protein